MDEVAKSSKHPKYRFKEEYKEAAESDSTAKLQAVINSATFTKKDAERAQTEKTFLVSKIKGFQNQETRLEKTIAAQAVEINRLKDQLLANAQKPSIPDGAANQNCESNRDFLLSEYKGITYEEALLSKISLLTQLIKILEEDDTTILNLKKDIAGLKQSIQERDAKIKALEDSKNIPDSNIESAKKRIQLLEDALSEFIAVSEKAKT